MTSVNEPAWAGTTPYSGSEAADLSPDSAGGGGTTEVAKQEVGNVAQSATGAAQQVAGIAKEQVAGVAADAKEHASFLAGETQDQVSQQVVAQRDRAVSALRSLAEELQSMIDGGGGTSGLASQLARQASDATHKAAGFIEEREPKDLLDELTGLARRRPGAFLLGAAVAGIAAGRLTRGLTSSGGQGPSSSSGSRPALPSSGIDMPAVGQSGYASQPPTYDQPTNDLATYDQGGVDQYDAGTSAYASEWSDAGTGRTESGLER